MVTYITQLRQRCIHGVNTINGLTRRWLRILVSAAKETLKPDTSIKAAAIAYFALFSLFPITILSISITSFSLDPLKNQQLIIQRLEFIAPAMGLLLGKNIDEIIKLIRKSKDVEDAKQNLIKIFKFSDRQAVARPVVSC